MVIEGKVGPLIRLRMSRATVSGSLLASSTTKARARGRAALLLPLSCSEASGLVCVCVCVCRHEQRAKDWIRFILAVGQSRNGQQTEGIKGVVYPFSSEAWMVAFWFLDQWHPATRSLQGSDTMLGAGLHTTYTRGRRLPTGIPPRFRSQHM